MADTEKVKIVVDVEDNATGKLRGIAGGLSNLQSNVARFNYALRQYNSAMSTFNNAMIRGVKEVGSAIYDFTSDAISNFSELSEQHAKTLGAMANNYDNTLESQQKFIENSEKMKQQAIDLAKYGVYYGTSQYTGQGSLYTATQVSEAQTELVKAGVSEEAILNTNVLSDIIQFAQANQLQTSQAVEFATALGSQFGIGYEDWGEMLDKVSHTADLSVIDVKDIVQSMKYAGGITSGLDRPIEEVLGMISVLGNFGLKGSQAGSGIQAFLTRLLTGDTTVITQAQTEVAPPKALEAFYAFSNIAKSGGDGLTLEQIQNATSFKDWANLPQTGQLRPMDEVMDALETTMSELNDEEQAWFAKKLFGLYQMKSAYALINGDESDIGLQDVIDNIRDQSSGTNANKLGELLNSQNGQIQSLKVLWDTTKTEFGMMLEPTTIAVIQELKNFLADPQNYNINWDNIRSALDESCDAIEEAYGSAIADAVRDIGNLTIDLGQVVEEMSPEFGRGMLEILDDVISGNLFGKDGLFADWESMITNMDNSVKNLPEDLQELGYKVVDVVDAFGKLAAINMATTIAQLVASTMQIALMTINAASVIVNGNTTGVGTGGVGTGGTGTGTGGTGGTGTNSGSGRGMNPSNPIYGIGNTALGMAGSYFGAKTTGDIVDKVVEENYIDDSSAMAQIAKTGIKIAGGGAGLFAGSALWKWLAAGGLKAAGGKLAMDADLALFNMGLASEMTGGAAALGATMALPAGILAAGVGMIGYEAYKNKQAIKAQQQTGEIVRNGGHVAFDKDGNLMKDNDGNVIDMQAMLDEYMAERAKRSDPYKYMNGLEEYITSAPPEANIWNLFGHTSGYKAKYKEWEDEQARIKTNMANEKEQFYKVQGNYYAMNNGTMLTWEDYKANKEDYDANYTDISESISTAAVSMETLAEEIRNMDLASVAEQIGVEKWSDVIPNFNVLSTQGQQEAVSQYVFGTNVDNMTTAIDNLNATLQNPLQLIGPNLLYGLPISNQTSTVNNKVDVKTGDTVVDNQVVNDITITPSFTMEAPQLQVDVTVKQDGTLLDQNVSLLNPKFNTTINSWYQRTASQNGSTTN